MGLRIDIGVLPVGNSKTKVTTFVNEIETGAATWLVRYVPFNIVKHMTKVYPKKINELLNGLKPGEKKPDAAAMEKLAAIVEKNSGEGNATKRKHASVEGAKSAKRVKSL